VSLGVLVVEAAEYSGTRITSGARSSRIETVYAVLGTNTSSEHAH